MRWLMSLIEQGLSSALTFGVSLWLIHGASAASYGVYVFWYAIALLANTAMGSLTAVHLFPLLPGAANLAERREPERVLLSVTMLLLIGVAGAAAGANGMLADGLRQPATSLFLPAFLIFQYARSLALSRGRLGLATGLAAAAASLAALGFGIDSAAGAPVDAPRALLIVGIAYGLPGSAALAVLAARFGFSFRPVVLSGFLPYLEGSRWILLGAGASECIMRLYSFVVVAWFGPAALGRLSAAQVVMRPASMLSGAWLSVGRPNLAISCRARDRAGLLATVWQGVALTAGASLAWTVAAVAAWPFVSSHLYHGRFADARTLVALWGANVVVAAIAAPMNVALQAMGAYRELAWLDVVAAGICAAGTFALLAHFDYGSSIVAILIGQAAQVVAMTIVLFRGLRLSFPGRSARPDRPAPVQHRPGNDAARVEDAVAQMADIPGPG